MISRYHEDFWSPKQTPHPKTKTIDVVLEEDPDLAFGIIVVQA